MSRKLGAIGLRRARAILLASVCCVVLVATTASGQGTRELGDDAKFLRAVVRAVADTVHEGLRIDPRQLLLTRSTSGPTAERDRWSERTPSATLTKVLAKEGIPTGEAFAEVACGGILAPPAGTQANRDCPSIAYTVVAFSRPWRVDSTKKVATRVVVRRYTPHGQSMTGFEYFFENRLGEWLLVARRATHILE